MEKGWGYGVGEFQQRAASAQPREFAIRVSIISDVCFLRESLAEILPRKGAVSITGLFADLRSALPYIANKQPDIILLDAGLPNGSTAVGQIRGAVPQVPVIVIGLADAPSQIIAWAEVGASGYIPRTARISDIVPLLDAILEGKQICSGSLAIGVLRWLFNCRPPNGRSHNVNSRQKLTQREAQIAQMITAGMSDKEIARCLDIGLATAKTHVHHILAKLNLQRRGQVGMKWTSGQSAGPLNL